MTQRIAETDYRLVITRTINAPRERVFQAWTEPARLECWWRAHEGWTSLALEVDLRVGGKYRLGMQDPEQEHPYIVGGVYREIASPERLAFTWTWEKRPGDDPDWTPATTLVTLELLDQDGATQLTLTHEQFPDANMRDQHQEGWSGCLDLLAQCLAD